MVWHFTDCLSSPIPTPKSRQHPGHRVLDAGGDLSSDSSESHTDVARRGESRRTPGLVDSSGCWHAGSRRHFQFRRGPLAENKRRKKYSNLEELLRLNYLIELTASYQVLKSKKKVLDKMI